MAVDSPHEPFLDPLVHGPPRGVGMASEVGLGQVSKRNGAVDSHIREGTLGTFAKGHPLTIMALCDRRHQSCIDHTYTNLIKQRVFQIACGCEDANDSNNLPSDPALKAACDRLPLTGEDLASQPTMSRFENSISRTDLYRIGLALLETFIESYDKPPKKIILDIDDTDDVTHGSQQLSLFHAYYDEYCYLPVHLYEAETGKLITTILRPGRRIRTAPSSSPSSRGAGTPSGSLGDGQLMPAAFLIQDRVQVRRVGGYRDSPVPTVDTQLVRLVSLDCEDGLRIEP